MKRHSNRNKPSDDEAAFLLQLEEKPLLSRVVGYLGLSGPGFLQGAMTLGGGSAVASLAIGANFGYEYLWVQPVSMIIGCVMLFALSFQTLSTGERPYLAMRAHVGRAIAWLWALATIVSSVIWGLAQYPIGAGMIDDIIHVFSASEASSTVSDTRDGWFFWYALLMYGFVALTAWNYSRGGRFVRTVEKTLKVLIAAIVVCFGAIVVGATLKGRIDWAGALLGFIPRSFPTDSKGLTTLMGAFGSAIGINMTFLYGYTLLRRNWGRPHRTLSRYDIALGLVVPYMIVVSLISIACASGLYPLAKPLEVQARLLAAEARYALIQDDALSVEVRSLLDKAGEFAEKAQKSAENDSKFVISGQLYRAGDAEIDRAEAILATAGIAGAALPAETQERISALLHERDDLIKPLAAAHVFDSSGIGGGFGRVVFCIGILAMTTNALIMHMLCCGFACAEVFGFPIGSMRYRLACLITTPAVLGVFFWQAYGMYIGLITSTICAFLLPIAYVGWLVMNNRQSYLGSETPRGAKRVLANSAMSVSIVIVVVALAYTTWVKLSGIL